MTATNHVMTGAVIGAAIGNPWLALPAALLSHVVMDALPHFDLSTDHTSRSFLYGLVTDIALAGSFLLFLLLFQPDGWLVFAACGVAAASPDLLWIPHWIQEFKGKPWNPQRRLEKFLDRIQWSTGPWGIAVELPWLGVMLYLFFRLTAA